MASVTKTKKPARKATVKRSAKVKTAALRAVDKQGRFILGYASHLASVRPGVDLTKPTLPPGKYLA
ncbi:MAG: hypothetical protein ABII82_11650 [Verrucomicrobiota bacterium]